MKIALPTVNDAGIGGRLSPHFGSAPYFTLADGDTGAVEAIANHHARHEHGACNPTGSLVGLGVDVVICRGLGWRALSILEGQGIAVYRTESWSVGEALSAFRANQLSLVTDEQACRH